MCGLVAISSIAPTPAVALPATSHRDRSSDIIAQTGVIVRPALSLGSRGSEVRETPSGSEIIGILR
ncbi:MAG: hypothetical protein ACM65M_19275 [Microcoleus sp.]